MKTKIYHTISSFMFFWVIFTFVSITLQAEEASIKNTDSASGIASSEMITNLSQDKSEASTDAIIKEIYNKERTLEEMVQLINILSERADKKSQDKILKALSDVILNGKNNVTTYSAILAIGYIGNYKNPDVVKAIHHSLENRMDDVYIADIINKIKENVPDIKK